MAGVGAYLVGSPFPDGELEDVVCFGHDELGSAGVADPYGWGMGRNDGET